MAIQFHCPTCDQSLSLANRLAGKTTKCPACQRDLTVPLESADLSLPPTVEPPAMLPTSWRRLSVVLASLFVVVASVAAAIPMALVGNSPKPGPTTEQVQPATVDQPDELASEEDEPASLQQEKPAAASATSSNPAQAAQPVGPAQQEPKPSEQKAQPPAVGKLVNQPNPPAAKPEPEKKSQTVQERWASKRRDRLTDEELRRQLLLPTEVDIDAVPGTSKKIVSLSGKTAGSGVDVVPQFTSRRADLIGLPLHAGALARMGLEEALNLKVLSQRLRLMMQSALPAQLDNVIDPRPDPETLRQRLLNHPQQATWFRPQAIATLRQLLMHEHRNVRLVLVDILSRIDGSIASMALAERAIFDLDPDVRLTAITALKSRPVAEYQSALLAGLRYPWAAAADHAAEALVALDMRNVAPKLLTMLDVRDMNEPYPVTQGQARVIVVPELVRINHLRNCLLCHAYSASSNDPIRGLAPNADRLVPLPIGQRPATKWKEGGPVEIGVPTATFVRPDITFFRQDFSVLQPVPNHGRLWPSDQRFDYLVRLRPLTLAEIRAWQDKFKEVRPPAPQRESLLYALRELTGENPGPTVEDWRRVYSPLSGHRLDKPLTPEEELQYVKNYILLAPPIQQAERVAALQDKTGSVYDVALATIIPQLPAALQKSARSILVDRLFCLPLKELTDKLHGTDIEMKRAGVVVCRQRKLKSLTPELIELLDDSNLEIARSVHQVLVQFAARDLGPRPAADQEAKLEAKRAWREWWEQQSQKRAGQKGTP